MTKQYVMFPVKSRGLSSYDLVGNIWSRLPVTAKSLAAD
jgi:hypothetical protein